MDVHEILEAVKAGTISVEEAEAYFRRKPFEDLPRKCCAIRHCWKSMGWNFRSLFPDERPHSSCFLDSTKWLS